MPIISPISSFLFGRPVKLPDGHLAIVKNGPDKNAPVADRWLYRGADLYAAYRTVQEFLPRDHTEAAMLYTYLPPWYLSGRYLPVKDWAFWRQWINERAYLVALLLLPFAFVSLVTAPLSAYAVYSNFQSNKTIEQLTQKLAAIPAPAVSPATQTTQATPQIRTNNSFPLRCRA